MTDVIDRFEERMAAKSHNPKLDAEHHANRQAARIEQAATTMATLFSKKVNMPPSITAFTASKDIELPAFGKVTIYVTSEGQLQACVMEDE